MDDIDRKLVEKLRDSARTSYAELARQVGLTSPSVQERVAKLEKSGVITAYRADVDPEALGLGVTALVGIVTASGREYADVTEALSAIPVIESCYFLAGAESYLLKVRVASMAELEELIMQLGRVPGVAGTRTTVALSTKWESRPQPPRWRS